MFLSRSRNFEFKPELTFRDDGSKTYEIERRTLCRFSRHSWIDSRYFFHFTNFIAIFSKTALNAECLSQTFPQLDLLTWQAFNTRPTISHFQSLKIRRSTLLNYMNYLFLFLSQVCPNLSLRANLRRGSTPARCTAASRSASFLTTWSQRTGQVYDTNYLTEHFAMLTSRASCLSFGKVV